MQPLFLLIGPPAVGKSTTSKGLAAKFGKSIHIPVDDIRDMVVSGLVLPSLEWNQDLVLQITLARESVIQMALNYQRAGFAVVIDDFLDPNQLQEYRTLLSKPRICGFVLYPNQDTAHARNFQRAGDDTPWRDGIDVAIRFVYQQLNLLIEPLRHDGWIVLNTSEMNVEETVLEILKHSELHSP